MRFDPATLRWVKLKRRKTRTKRRGCAFYNNALLPSHDLITSTMNHQPSFTNNYQSNNSLLATKIIAPNIHARTTLPRTDTAALPTVFDALA